MHMGPVSLTWRKDVFCGETELTTIFFDESIVFDFTRVGRMEEVNLTHEMM